MIGNAPIRAGFESLTSEWANWFTAAGSLLQDAQRIGTTAERPTVGLYVGKPYFDTTLGLPVLYNGTGWINYAGASV